MEISLAGTSHVSEIQFEDDPRLTPQLREQSKREGYVIVPTSKDSDGTLRVTANFSL